MENDNQSNVPSPRPRRRRGRTICPMTAEKPAAGPKTEPLMLINCAEGDECRIAILENGRLEELYMERASAESHVGNIYKGRVTNVEPSIQAAFVDFGLERNGFLHISDLQPQYFPNNRGEVEEVGKKTPRRERPPIQRCLRRGQEVIVQITKEGIGTKGPTLTTYLSVPGRYLVLMPGMNRLGVSRKIEDEETRRKMREILDDLKLPDNMGFILRTAGLDKTKRELQRDLMYLQRLWKVVATRVRTERAPAELYRESDLVIRTIRDAFTSDFGRILVDDAAVAQRAREFLEIVNPRKNDIVEVYEGPEPLFHRYGIEAEIEKINARRVPLPSGGSIVIDSTEALVAVDVNSGTFRDPTDAEETAHRINLEAAEEIARQLRLRDLGGVIIIDFIDMRFEKNRRDIERAVRDALKKHKERARILRMSQFGIIEMTRQRQRPSIKRSIYQDCPSCKGAGLVKNAESMSLDVMRLLRLATNHAAVASVTLLLHPTVAFDLLNRKRGLITQLESDSGRAIVIRGDSNMGIDELRVECRDRREHLVDIHAGAGAPNLAPPRHAPPHRPSVPSTGGPAPHHAPRPSPPAASRDLPAPVGPAANGSEPSPGPEAPNGQSASTRRGRQRRGRRRSANGGQAPPNGQPVEAAPSEALRPPVPGETQRLFVPDGDGSEPEAGAIADTAAEPTTPRRGRRRRGRRRSSRGNPAVNGQPLDGGGSSPAPETDREPE